MKKEKLKTMEEAGWVIQVCDCGKVDAYKNDGHDCALVAYNLASQEYYD